MRAVVGGSKLFCFKCASVKAVASGKRGRWRDGYESVATHFINMTKCLFQLNTNEFKILIIAAYMWRYRTPNKLMGENKEVIKKRLSNRVAFGDFFYFTLVLQSPLFAILLEFYSFLNYLKLPLRRQFKKKKE